MKSKILAMLAIGLLGCGQAMAAFVDKGGGVILDSSAMLEWEQVTYANTLNWADAGTYASSLTLSGGAWRLPTINELTQLYSNVSTATGCADCTGIQGPFTIPHLGYWTSNQYFAGQPGAYVVGFWQRPNDVVGLFQTSSAGVWAVRAGSPVPLPAAAWLLLSGLGGLGLLGRRRKAA